MLFSEPKIPQYNAVRHCDALRVARFSALQRAENSSIINRSAGKDGIACFSALQRAENSSIGISAKLGLDNRRFSALQRAENSSIFALIQSLSS